MARGSGRAFWIGVAAGAAAFGLLLLGERKRPLRRSVESKARRVARNLAMAAVGTALAQAVERPLTRRVAALVERRDWGLLPWLGVPRGLRAAAAFLLLDYTLWVWHVLNHRFSPLWRFHAVHHADLDLDASTALRFHAGELMASVPWRVAQVVLIGVGPRALASWQAALFVSVVFHHSNLRLPLHLERTLARLFVTPRQHGIHHSVVPEETDSNWSSLLNVWDRLHGTLRLDVPQSALTIGVPALSRPEEVRLARLLKMPFEEPPDYWRRPDGSRPTRTPRPRARQLIA